jgi:hypothetical protein
MTARRFMKVGYYSEATAFSLLKKTLEGEAKRIVENLSVEDCYALDDLLQALDDEYGDVDFLAAEQRRKITDMKRVSYGARNLLDFCQTVNKARRILEDVGQDVDTKDFVSLVVSRLQRAYQSRLADAMRCKKKKGLDATMQELREIAVSKRANKKRRTPPKRARKTRIRRRAKTGRETGKENPRRTRPSTPSPPTLSSLKPRSAQSRSARSSTRLSTASATASSSSTCTRTNVC